jgi:transposase
MNNNTRYIGIDLSKKSMKVAYVQDNKKIKIKEYETTKKGKMSFIKTLSKNDVVAMETGNGSFVFAKQIMDKVSSKTHVLNAGKLHIIFKSMKKTDKNDAINIAKFIQRIPEEELPTVNLPTEEEMYIRSLMNERERAVKNRTSTLNSIHNLFWNNGITQLNKSDIANYVKLEKNIKLLPNIYKNQIERLSSELKFYDNKISEINDELNKLSKSKIDKITISMSVPGVGPVTALAIYAFMGDMSRFSSREQVSYYSGLTPRIDCSGDQNHYGKITREGPSLLRKLLVQCALSCIRSKGGENFKMFYEHIKSRRGKGRAIVATARKILEIIYILHKKDELFKTENDDDDKRTIAKLKRYKLL